MSVRWQLFVNVDPSWYPSTISCFLRVTDSHGTRDLDVRFDSVLVTTSALNRVSRVFKLLAEGEVS